MHHREANNVSNAYFSANKSYYSKPAGKSYADSFRVLMELACCDPIVQECLALIDNVCLCRALDFNIVNSSGKSVSEKTNATLGRKRSMPQDEFKRFINKHYTPFLKEAIRSMHVLGFVAWTTVRLESGDMVPEVLPFGTYTWSVGPDPDGKALLKIRIEFQSPIEPVSYFVKSWVSPTFNICENSAVLPTLQTPFCHLVEEYMVLRRALRRHHHADAWNCTARIFVNDEPKTFAHDAEKKELFETIDFIKDLQSAFKKKAVDPVDEVFQTRQSDHGEIVYPLPSHRHVEAAPVLQPVTDISTLTARFRTNVCAVMGIPPELLAGSSRAGGGSSSSDGKSTSTSASASSLAHKLLHVKMLRVTGFLADLAADVYRTIYKGEEAEFEIAPLPRMQVESVADLKMLFEIGMIDDGNVEQILQGLFGGAVSPPKKLPTPPVAQEPRDSAS
jgi:hypothetical protein